MEVCFKTAGATVYTLSVGVSLVAEDNHKQ